MIDNTAPVISWYEHREQPIFLPPTSDLDLTPTDSAKSGRQGGEDYYLPLSQTEPEFSIEYFVDGESIGNVLFLGDYETGRRIPVEVRVTDIAGNSASAKQHIESELSIRSVLGYLDFSPPSVFPHGELHTYVPPVAPVFMTTLGMPQRQGVQADPALVPFVLCLGMDTPVGMVYLSAPIDSPLGLGAKWRIPGFSIAGVPSAAKYLSVDVGLAPIFLQTIHRSTSPFPEETLSEIDETFKRWLRLGVSSSLIPSGILSSKYPFNVWITLGVEYLLAIDRTLAIR